MNLLVMYSNWPPSAAHLARLESISGVDEVVVAHSEQEAVDNAANIDVILGHRYLRQALPYTRRLAWVQSTAAGIDHLISEDLLRIRPLLTRCPISSETVALHAFTMALALIRRLPDAMLAQTKGVWSTLFTMLPLPKTAMVLGMGSIGQALSTILRNHGIIVYGVNRSRSAAIERCCDRLLLPSQWKEHLPGIDILFVTLPLTPATWHYVDAAALQTLPTHAVVVNVARGAVIDIDALVDLLWKDRLGGAALDVLETIPDSPENPIWKVPRLLITPKIAALDPDRQSRLESFIEQQVQRYTTGSIPKHVVDYLSLYSCREGE